MYTMGEEKDMFAGLGWEKEIRSLEYPHIFFTPSPEHNKCAGNQCSDNHKLTPFSQSTQAWRWRMQDKRKQYEKNQKKRADVLKEDVDVIEDANLNEEKVKDMEKEVKVVSKSSRFLLFRERMRGLSPHYRSLKDRMRNKTVSYVDLL